MTEPRSFVLLTQANCPQCARLELMLEKPLRGQFAQQIERVHRQEHPGDFARLAERHGLRSTPALLHVASGTLLLNTGSLGEVSAFLRRG